MVPNNDKKSKRIFANITTGYKSFEGYFQGDDHLDLEEGQPSTKYKITYHPLTMTKSEQVPLIKQEFHEGSLFFPLPSGKAFLYKLKGISKPPNCKETFNINMKAKKTHIHTFTLVNWLPNN